ncbi:MAG: hypothetical protein AAGC55_29150, partial [Myxococcota bacterium]
MTKTADGCARRARMLALVAALALSWTAAATPGHAQETGAADAEKSAEAAADKSDGDAGAGESRERTDEPDAEGGDEPDERTTAACIDREIANRLAIKRQRRGAVDRLFVKQAPNVLSSCR